MRKEKKKLKREAPMKFSSFVMPESWHLLLADLVRENYYQSKSAAIRAGIRDLLRLHDKI